MPALNPIERELASAVSAWNASNEGKARVCARRAVALADEAWLMRQAQPGWSGDAIAHLHRIQEEPLFPSVVRQAAERLTTTVTRRQTAQFTINPVGDATIIIDCLMPGGRTGSIKL